MLRNEIKLHETSETGKQDIIQDNCNKVETLNSTLLKQMAESS